VRTVHHQIEVRHRKTAARLRLAVGAQHRSAVPDGSGNPDITPLRFTRDGEFELLLDGIPPHLPEGLDRFVLRELDVEVIPRAVVKTVDDVDVPAVAAPGVDDGFSERVSIGLQPGTGVVRKRPLRRMQLELQA